MSELPFSKRAEDKLNEIGFIVPIGAIRNIRSLAEALARYHNDHSVTVESVESAYRYWFYRQKEEVKA